MEDFKGIINMFELSDFFTITSGKFEFVENEQGEITKLISAPEHRTANENDFEDLFFNEAEKRKIKPFAYDSFRAVLSEEISELIQREKSKEKDRKNINLIAISQSFIAWLNDPKNINFESELPENLVTSIGILHRTGIINFLMTENPKAKPYHIAQLLKTILQTDKTIPTIQQYLTDEKKHPLNDNLRVKEIDEVLDKFNITSKKRSI